MRLTRYSLRELRLRPGRTVLTLLGIAFGVAAVLAIALVIDTTRRAYREMHETIAGRAALETTKARPWRRSQGAMTTALDRLGSSSRTSVRPGTAASRTADDASPSRRGHRRARGFQARISGRARRRRPGAGRTLSYTHLQ